MRLIVSELHESVDIWIQHIMGLGRTELEPFRDKTVPDLLTEDLRLLFTGIDPELWPAATGAASYPRLESPASRAS